MQRSAHRTKLGAEDTTHFIRQRLAVFLCQLHGSARIGVGVTGAADDVHRLHSRVTFLNSRLSEAREIAAKLIIVGTERGAMDGRTKKHGTQLAVGTVDAHHGNGAVRQTARVDAENDAARSELAAVHDEIDHAAAPGELRRFQMAGCIDDSLNHFFLKPMRILDDPQPLA